MAMYTILQVFNNDRTTEHTNVGAALYDGDEFFGCLATGPERAVARGDMPADIAEYHTRSSFERYMRSVPRLCYLRAKLDSMGHAMSYIRFRNPLWTREASTKSLQSVFDHFVLGK